MGRKDKLVQDNDSLPIGARMRLARQRRKLSLKDMAEKLTYSVPHLSTIENGRRKPTPELVKIYEQQLDLKSGTLLDFLVEPEKEALPVSAESAPEEIQVEIDWGEVPDIPNFYGREKELEQLSSLVARYRIVAIVGIGGVGKTSLAAQLAHRTEQFNYIFWFPLQNMHSLEYLLRRCITSMSQHKQVELPDNEDELILQLIGYLRKHRCLLILDNFETVLQESKRVGQYDDSHKGYGKLLKRVGESRHQSCLLLTSREKPGEVAYLEGSSALAAVLPLTGVGDQEARDILKDKELRGTDADWSNLNKLYSVYPLALELVYSSIREMFDGHIGKFLSQGAAVFGDIYDLLNQQIRRLSP